MIKKYIGLLSSVIVAFCCIQTVVGQNKLVDRVVATVGSSIILQSDVEMQYAQYLAQGEKPNDDMKCYLLQQLVTQKLLSQQAMIDSIEVSEAEVDDNLNRRMQVMVRQAGGKERLEEFLNRSLLQYKEEMRSSVAEQLKAQKMQQNIVTTINVTPQEVKTYFNGLNQDSLPYFNTEVEIGEIVINPELTKEEKEQFRQKAEGYRQQVLNGSDFGTVARLYSEDGSAPYGGELGFATRDSYVKEFSAMAFKLKEGEISPVFETMYGFHFLQVLQRRGEEVNVRHLLIKKKPTSASLERAKAKIDSIYDKVTQGKISFHAAASQYSDNNETKYTGGMIMNEEDHSGLIPVDRLDRETFTAIDPLEVGQYSKSFLSKDRMDNQVYKFMYLKSRVAPHKANLEQDFAKIQEAARQDKINRKLSEWFEQRKENTFIDINSDFMQCDELKLWINKDEALAAH
ncbi:periplasmic chaperone for outer membrane proteins SurA [Sphingobacterium allocomposti]|uniref:Periplasmic chaperone for outer membrane proteins SurA n=1 Tax=Sphingobacterium allocomposti TaxID=415956 RepID=A0A5S5DB67_9SPHI|nr:peptidylprolyl isomerase [Sphingobacterium composti Yoo et al. 2007 non Ten et al. 2007]TYP92935.1 periplasmic chaperone for outer membrane proteins SurA [Sphingobacterium composti Yoo et al. 2007 non Ten et al. 2007]HLS96714.1 peptidylprolyl isomerase [Sphingobacterium sp.]